MSVRSKQPNEPDQFPEQILIKNKKEKKKKKRQIKEKKEEEEEEELGGDRTYCLSVALINGERRPCRETMHDQFHSVDLEHQASSCPYREDLIISDHGINVITWNKSL